MAYVAPIHRATSVRHALRANVIDADIDDLVVAKANRLEIWRLTEEGLVCQQTKLIYGTISMLQRLRPKGSETDLLFIGTERLQYFTLIWNDATKKLETIEQAIIDQSEPYMRQSQSQNKCLVDPTGRFLAMHLWEGVLNVFRLPIRKGSTNKLELLEQVRLTELFMKASTFTHSRTGHPTIAFLYKTQMDQEEARLAIYRLTHDDKGNTVSKFDPHKDREFDVAITDPYASMLIPVPLDEEKRYHVRNTEGGKAHLGGILVVGETLLIYYDGLTHRSVSSALRDPRIFVAWAEYDGTHYLLADDYGRLDLLTIQTNLESTGVVVTGMTLEPFTTGSSPLITSRASSLVYLGDGTLFVASHHGDSQHYQIDIETRAATLMQSFSNNAPILDFSIMDMGNREGDTQAGNVFSSGQSRIVAGCGAYRDGTLRSIRSGVGLEDRGVLDELEGTRGLFTLRSYGADSVDTLVVSSITETRVLSFDSEGGIEEIYSFEGMSLDCETLLASNLPNGQLLQITPNSVVLLDPEGGTTVSKWDVPSGKTITRASANGKWALLSVDGTSLVSLNLLQNLAVNAQQVQSDSDSPADQISCIHAARDPPDLGVVGWWSSGQISLIDMASLKPLHGESMRQTEDSATVPRDVALVQLHPPDVSGPTLLVAMEDGNVVTFNVSTRGFSVSGRKSVTLGSNPARLHILPQEDGTSNVFVTTEHASLIYSSDGRIIFSATTADDATFVAPFNSHAFPDSVVLSTDQHIRICHVDRERLTHVKALPVNETVRRVAYSPGLKAFGVGAIKRELVNNEEVVTSSFRLVDEIVFKELGSPFPLKNSSSLELVECVIRAELPDVGGNPTERFIVGTSFINDGVVEDSNDTLGRILVLGVDANRQVYQIVSHNLKGPCRCLGMIEDNIVAGLSKTVVVYNFTQETSSSGSLQKLAAYRPSAIPIDLDVSGNMIGVGDLMQSLSLIEFVPAQDGNKAKLEERARHYESIWTTAVCHIEGERWLEADSQGNLVVLQQNVDAPTEQDRSRLQITSEIGIGEQINRIRKLNVPAADNSIVHPRAFLATVEGSLYLYGDIAPQYQDLLMTFQSRMEEYIHVPGNVEFKLWRSFRNDNRESEGPFRFIDGEMIERFLDMDEGKQELVCEGLGPSVEDMRNLIEELRRMH
ncbi:mono-functional DNA-alkylating methyl methanesulfonate N-term-domain-containing protein [Fusarium flagelliforme]|uniref:DNA damage-binding protein 1 n=1 Tax=Fusarium flagelliforme TaxID=2675880 RepID=A0A395N4T1_9HYPO|nr:mono-functional DNA-alkylating methyl methanesulfonate N-term-domain-containing protein [Fusarium flagelliforme]KAH7189364.1 mono-functional DNA-alkylating methyl methanesulfonate N-term-domain-containing protein [Fusarium flagelliforme]RFN54887.1 DNA damage-binding protein 1 [Fusarium flagelliforme]